MEGIRRKTTLDMPANVNALMANTSLQKTVRVPRVSKCPTASKRAARSDLHPWGFLIWSVKKNRLETTSPENVGAFHQVPTSCLSQRTKPWKLASGGQHECTSASREAYQNVSPLPSNQWNLCCRDRALKLFKVPNSMCSLLQTSLKPPDDL